MKIHEDISQNKLLDILELDQDTIVYCCNPDEVVADKFEIGDVVVCRYKDNYRSYIFEVFVVAAGCSGYKYLRTANEKGPALITKDEYGDIHVYYYKDGRQHRPMLPAFIHYDKDGFVIEEYYKLNGRSHNYNAPAIRVFRDGCWYNSFYIWGRRVTRDVFFRVYEKRQLNEKSS